MTLKISPEKMAEYRAGARKREAERQAALDERFQLAWEVARQGAEILKSQFGAKKVVVFGSLIDRNMFHAHSDIDLAAWGISEQVYLRAGSSLLELSTEFSVDLVLVESAPTRLQKNIERDGMPL